MRRPRQKAGGHFNPRAPRGARQQILVNRRGDSIFQSTCPARGTTRRLLVRCLVRLISIHVPREGHDRLAGWAYPPRPAISIHVPREGHDLATNDPRNMTKISIHMPREGHDKVVTAGKAALSDFNPRAPRGARPRHFSKLIPMGEFQSTCPARGTTSREVHCTAEHGISIHVPREGHDLALGGDACGRRDFNPRAPRGARPTTAMRLKPLAFDFNPRAPRGARHPLTRVVYPVDAFQSTCPARGTTRACPYGVLQHRFQSTCPARGTTRQLFRRDAQS